MKSKHIVAIEISSSKIKGAVGTFDDANNLTVLAIEEEKFHSDIVRYGLIQNVDQVSNSLTAICQRLHESYDVKPREIRSVYTSIGGRSLMSTPCEITDQYHEEIKITDDYCERLKNEARGYCPEGREVLAVVPRDYIIDNISHKTKPVGVFGKNIKAMFTLITCRPALRRNIDRVFDEKLDLRINDYIVRPLAEADLVLTDEEKNLGCMFVDFGAETTSCAIYKGGVLTYAATIPMGSRNITRDLMSLNVTEERAEDIKKALGNVTPATDSPVLTAHDVSLDSTEINKCISARAGEIISNIIAQITYAGVKPADLPGGIIIVGGGAKLRGFGSLLSSQSKMEVRSGSPSGLIRTTNPDFHSQESVDIIALLSACTKNNPIECMELPEDEEYDEEYDEEEYDEDDDHWNDNEKSHRRNNDEEIEEGSRIGRDLPWNNNSRHANNDNDTNGNNNDTPKKKKKEPSLLMQRIAKLKKDVAEWYRKDGDDDDDKFESNED